jgi:hypothetical protein
MKETALNDPEFAGKLGTSGKIQEEQEEESEEGTR